MTAKMANRESNQVLKQIYLRQLFKSCYKGYNKCLFVEYLLISVYRFSERAEMAAGWWLYDVFVTPKFLQQIFQIVLPREELTSKDKKSAKIKLVDMSKHN